ncbi:sulfatase [Pelagicoccus mobilis]|uniref:Sulfatase n=1 Tax=Pelagicoccus mobilis TaxID=415221 RepID=A0A934VQ17_9BACT|nr:sulfatase [Pelagicoccus mobilis]MBK1876064.1 sulfatase [Pelagicoccus mobilis]
MCSHQAKLPILIITLFGCFLSSYAKNLEDTEKPNIIFIISDDAGYADFGFHGADKINTPNLDRIAQQGAVFENAYVSASVCCPSRMGLMTGRYQQRFGAECNVPTVPTPGFGKEHLGLDIEEKTIGDQMQNAGYRTMMIGKWHLGHQAHHHPLKRGFDEFYGFLGGSRSFWSLDKTNVETAMRRNHEQLDEASEVTYLTDDLTDAAIDFIERNHKQPFFIYLSYNAVHTPMHAKVEDIEQQAQFDQKDRRIYAAMTKSMDDNIGRLDQFLAKNGLTQNTLVVFTNDNGGATSNASENNPLRGYKGSYWEGGIRVPFVMRWPGKIPPQTRYSHSVSTLDLLPTALGAAQAPAIGKPLDGVDLIPHVNGEKSDPPHHYLYWRLWRTAAIRNGHWKLIRLMDDPLTQDRRLLAPPILIDLDKDPSETTNLAEQYPEIVAHLSRKLEAWESGLSAPRWYDGKDWPKWARVQLENHRMGSVHYE